MKVFVQEVHEMSFKDISGSGDHHKQLCAIK